MMKYQKINILIFLYFLIESNNFRIINNNTVVKDLIYTNNNSQLS